MLADQDVDRDAGEQRRDRREAEAERPVSTASSTVASEKIRPEQQPRRHEQLDRIVEVVAEPVVAAAGSAISRSDSFMSALNAVSMVPT